MAKMKNQAETEIDLKPWAAYVVGHHPYTLLLWHEMLWYDLTYCGPDVDEQSWEPIATEIHDLNEALRILAVEDLVKPGVLIELHRIVEGFESIGMTMVESPSLDDEAKRTMPGNHELLIMGDLSARVMEAPEELEAWRRLGAAVGLRKYFLNGGPDGGHGQDLERPRRVQELARGLPTRDKTIKAIKKILQTVSATIPEARGRFLELSRLDGELRAQLAHRVAPEPILVLDRETLSFFGETRPLKAFPQIEMACLWILAERAGRSIPRQDIIREGSVNTDEHNLKFVVSRLRKHLRAMAEAHCLKHGCARPSGLEDGFIRGERLRGYRAEGSCGPYALALDPALVRIQGPRPDWMKGRFGRDG